MRYAFSIFVLISSLVLTCCSVEQHIADAQNELMSTYSKLPDTNSLQEQKLSWSKALVLLENNLELQRAKHAIKEAERQYTRVYTDFIPLIDIGHFYSKAIINDNSGSSAPSSFNVNIIFNLPSLLRLPVEQYTRSLALYKAEQDLKLKRRELTAKLWQLFRESSIAHKKQELEDASLSSQQTDPQLRKRERELQQRDCEQKISALLNDYSAHWRPIASSLPKLNWQDYRQKAKVPDELTQISMALALEAARLQKLGVAVRYLPNFQVNFYSPSLFSSTGGGSQGFMGGDSDIRVNLNTYLTLDTRLEIWSEWTMAQENYHLVQKELTHNMYEYRNKMQLLLDSWATYEEWKRSTRDYINFRRTQSFCTPEDFQKLYNEDMSLQKELLDQEAKNVERECALIQEYGVPS